MTCSRRFWTTWKRRCNGDVIPSVVEGPVRVAARQSRHLTPRSLDYARDDQREISDENVHPHLLLAARHRRRAAFPLRHGRDVLARSAGAGYRAGADGVLVRLARQSRDADHPADADVAAGDVRSAALSRLWLADNLRPPAAGHLLVSLAPEFGQRNLQAVRHALADHRHLAGDHPDLLRGDRSPLQRRER